MGEVEVRIGERGVEILTVHRPPVRNALNREARRGMADAVRGSGPASAGRCRRWHGFHFRWDLAELRDYPSRPDGLMRAIWVGDALSRPRAWPCPTISAINGPARGRGARIALACDPRIMTEEADPGLVHFHIGLKTTGSPAREALSLRLTDRGGPSARPGLPPGS